MAVQFEDYDQILGVSGTATAVLRVRTIQRLRCDLGVNLSGVAVIPELIERLRSMRRELD